MKYFFTKTFDQEGNIVCMDCMAHYKPGFRHVCPEWMKILVAMNRKKNAKEHGTT